MKLKDYYPNTSKIYMPFGCLGYIIYALQIPQNLWEESSQTRCPPREMDKIMESKEMKSLTTVQNFPCEIEVIWGRILSNLNKALPGNHSKAKNDELFLDLESLYFFTKRALDCVANIFLLFYPSIPTNTKNDPGTHLRHSFSNHLDDLPKMAFKYKEVDSNYLAYLTSGNMDWYKEFREIRRDVGHQHCGSFFPDYIHTTYSRVVFDMKRLKEDIVLLVRNVFQYLYYFDIHFFNIVKNRDELDKTISFLLTLCGRRYKELEFEYLMENSPYAIHCPLLKEILF